MALTIIINADNAKAIAAAKAALEAYKKTDKETTKSGEEAQKKRSKAEEEAAKASKKHADAVGKLWKSAFAAVSTAAVLSFGKSMVQAYADQEEAIAGVRHAMETARTYTAAAEKANLNYIASLQATTTHADEVILASQKLLVSVGGLSGDGLNQATKASLDMADALNMDLNTAFTLMAKAAVGETATLSRYGIVLEEGIPKAEKFAAVLALVNDKFAGAAEAKAKTFPGLIANMKNAWGEFAEEVGGALVPMLTNLAYQLNEVFKVARETLLPLIQFLGQHPTVTAFFAAFAVGVPAVISATMALGAFGFTLTGVTATLGTTVTMSGALSGAMSALGISAGGAATGIGALAAVLGPALLLGAIVAVLGYVTKLGLELKTITDEAAQAEMASLAKQMYGVRDAAKAMVEEGLVPNQIKAIGKTFEEFGVTLDTTSLKTKAGQQTALELSMAMQSLEKIYGDNSQAIIDYAMKMGKGNLTFDNLNIAMKNADKILDKVGKSAKGAAEGMKEFIPSEDDIKSIEKLNKEIAQTANNMKLMDLSGKDKEYERLNQLVEEYKSSFDNYEQNEAAKTAVAEFEAIKRAEIDKKYMLERQSEEKSALDEILSSARQSAEERALIGLEAKDKELALLAKQVEEYKKSFDNYEENEVAKTAIAEFEATRRAEIDAQFSEQYKANVAAETQTTLSSLDAINAKISEVFGQQKTEAQLWYDESLAMFERYGIDISEGSQADINLRGKLQADLTEIQKQEEAARLEAQKLANAEGKTDTITTVSEVQAATVVASQSMLSGMEAAMTTITEMSVIWLNGMIQDISLFGQTVIDTFASVAQTVGNNLVLISDQIINTIMLAQELAMMTGGGGGGGMVPAPSGGGLPQLDIMGSATGNIFTQPNITQIAEGGKSEAVIPLQSSSGISTLSKALTLAGGGGASVNMPISVTVNTKGEMTAEQVAEKVKEKVSDPALLRALTDAITQSVKRGENILQANSLATVY